jgi:hypothetical protein
MTLEVSLPAPTGPEVELWPLMFELARDLPDGWAVVGAQMVIIHAAAHGIARPTRTGDVDILVDLQSRRPREIARWFQARGFVLAGVSADGVGHAFRRGPLAFDVLATDHAGPRTDTTTVPPIRTVEVPGGRRAARRLITASMTVGSDAGVVPIPDWVGALLLKARAATDLGQPARHLHDLALLLALPVDVLGFAKELSDRERHQLQRAIDLLDDDIWRNVSGSVDARAGRAAARLVGRR